MVVYLDLVILSTVLVNTLMIMGIECILNGKLSIIRVILSNVVLVLSLGLYLINIKELIFIRYLIGILIGYISFNKCNIKSKIIKIVVYYLFNISLVGVLEIFEIRNLGLLILSVIFIICLGMIISFHNKNELEVKVNNLSLNALYDSGNYSFYKGVPVVYLDYKYFNSSFIFVDKLVVNTISSKTLINIYTGPVLKINNKVFNVYYAFSDIKNFDVILHKDLGGIGCLSY
jgi:hypothetical protein